MSKRVHFYLSHYLTFAFTSNICSGKFASTFHSGEGQLGTLAKTESVRL